MTAASAAVAKTPPRLLVRTFWAAAPRGLSGQRRPDRPLASRGRQHGSGCCGSPRSGDAPASARIAIVGYYEDGPNLVTLAMNGWADAEPAWWLNLQAQPDTTVDLPDGRRDVRARAATGEERERLWAQFRDYPGWGDDIDALAARRSIETAVVVLEPRKPVDHGGSFVMRLLRELSRRKLRTTLTIIGITIGIWALVVFSSMANQINGLVGMGSEFYADKIVVTDGEAFGTSPMRLDDVEIDRRRSMASPRSSRRSSSSGSPIRRSASATPDLVTGVVPGADAGHETFELELATGRMLTAEDAGNVVVLGATVARKHGVSPATPSRSGARPSTSSARCSRP